MFGQRVAHYSPPDPTVAEDRLATSVVVGVYHCVWAVRWTLSYFKIETYFLTYYLKCLLFLRVRGIHFLKLCFRSSILSLSLDMLTIVCLAVAEDMGTTRR